MFCDKRTTSMSFGSRSDGVNSFSWFPALSKIKRCRTLALRGGKQATSETKTGHLKKFTKGAFEETNSLFRRLSPLDSSEQKRNNVLLMFQYEEEIMLKTFVEEAAALTSIALFVAMIAIWAQLIPQL
jgi:hypothetical protein